MVSRHFPGGIVKNIPEGSIRFLPGEPAQVYRNGEWLELGHVERDEIKTLKAENARLKETSITFEDLAKWLERQRQGFYLGCRIDPHSPQINEFVGALHYYLEKDFGFVTEQRKKQKAKNETSR
jgi:hypothetical protein